MQFSTKILVQKLLKSIIRTKNVRFYCNFIQEKELTVQAFCNVHVNLPCSVFINPLDVHKYLENDKLKITLISPHKSTKNLILVKYLEISNKIEICNGGDPINPEAKCLITAPVKSNLNVTSQGNITTGPCSGAELILNSINGNISVDKYQGERLDLKTENGNVTIKDSALATEIYMEILKSGNISIKRIQGTKAKLKTSNGNINVDSSYCDLSTFTCGNRGDLMLRNVHKNCKVHVNHGNLNLTGFDGSLNACVENGSADIQLSQISGNSNIEIKSGNLILRLSENCQKNVIFEITAGSLLVDPAIKLGENCDTSLRPSVKVDCGENCVDLKKSSFMEMFSSGFNK